MSPTKPDHDCGHLCCTTPHDPFHDHFLDLDDCPGCDRVRAAFTRAAFAPEPREEA